MNFILCRNFGIYSNFAISHKEIIQKEEIANIEIYSFKNALFNLPFVFEMISWNTELKLNRENNESTRLTLQADFVSPEHVDEMVTYYLWWLAEVGWLAVLGWPTVQRKLMIKIVLLYYFQNSKFIDVI